MGDVREGTVNGLPCLKIEKKVERKVVVAEKDRHSAKTYLRRRPRFFEHETPWYACFPDWWPYPPSERGPDCGFVYAEAALWSLGHVCPGIEQPEDPDKVRVVQHPVEFWPDEDEWENLP